MNGWIGVDLDGTLAVYNGWKGADRIGEPIAPMVDRVKQWLAEGKAVRIFTARVSPNREIPEEAQVAADAIYAWCQTHLGAVLPITYMKDYAMVELWDDHAVQVIANTGQRADGKE